MAVFQSLPLLPNHELDLIQELFVLFVFELFCVFLHGENTVNTKICWQVIKQFWSWLKV